MSFVVDPAFVMGDVVFCVLGNNCVITASQWTGKIAVYEFTEETISAAGCLLSSFLASKSGKVRCISHSSPALPLPCCPSFSSSIPLAPFGIFSILSLSLSLSFFFFSFLFFSFSLLCSRFLCLSVACMDVCVCVCVWVCVCSFCLFFFFLSLFSLKIRVFSCVETDC